MLAYALEPNWNIALQMFEPTPASENLSFWQNIASSAKLTNHLASCQSKHWLNNKTAFFVKIWRLMQAENHFVNGLYTEMISKNVLW